MSLVSRIRNKVQEVVGGMKESAGEAYGNQALEIDGEFEAEAAHEREAAEEAQHRHIERP